jgi:hypothetical protein
MTQVISASQLSLISILSVIASVDEILYFVSKTQFTTADLPSVRHRLFIGMMSACHREIRLSDQKAY